MNKPEMPAEAMRILYSSQQERLINLNKILATSIGIFWCVHISPEIGLIQPNIFFV